MRSCHIGLNVLTLNFREGLRWWGYLCTLDIFSGSESATTYFGKHLFWNIDSEML